VVPGQLTDELIGGVCEAVRPARPNGHGAAWELLSSHQADIQAWVDDDHTVAKIGDFLVRRGVEVPERTLQRFCVERCGAGKPKRAVLWDDDGMWRLGEGLGLLFRPTPRCPSPPTEHAEVGVLEVIVILESVTHQAVEPDVSEPDESEPQDQWPVLPPSQANHQSRHGGGVGQVVEEGPNSRSSCVARHRQIGKQQNDWDQPPVLPCGRIGDQRPRQEGCRLDPQPQPWRSRNGPVRDGSVALTNGPGSQRTRS